MGEWAGLLTGLLTFCAAMVLHAFLFGNRTGNVETEVATQKVEIATLKTLVFRMKSVLEIYTGVSVDGIDVKPRGEN